MVDRETSPYDSSELPHLGLKAFPTGELYFYDCQVPRDNHIGGSRKKKPKGDPKMVLQGFEFART